MILGIDEVGRGPWAGPLVVGAVVLGGVEIEGLTDSKKLSRKRREELDREIKNKAKDFALGWVNSREIDQLGLAESLKLATKRAVSQIRIEYNEIIIDGTVNFLAETNKAKYVTALKKADLLVPSVSAASIIAKVARDDFMASQDNIYTGYGFKSHVGYGTAKHRKAIEELGVTPLHRLSFAPLRAYRSTVHQNKKSSISEIILTPFRKNSVSEDDSTIINQKSVHDQIKLTTRSIGDSSEFVATKELQRQGHQIVERNWKTKYCEIDIISKKSDTLFFTEVKHRKSDSSGDGLEAITPRKLNQMKFAARFYVHSQKLDGKIDMCLMAIATTGNEPVITTVVEIV